MSERPLWRLVAGKKTGPYAPEKLRPLMKDGRISPLDRFSYDGVEWRPPSEFPELLRAPAPPPKPSEPLPVADDVDLLDDDRDLEGDVDIFATHGTERRGSGTVAGDDDVLDDAATKRLVRLIHGLIYVGIGVVVLLVVLMVATMVFYEPTIEQPMTATPRGPASPPPAVPPPVVDPKPDDPRPAEPGPSNAAVNEDSTDTPNSTDSIPADAAKPAENQNDVPPPAPPSAPQSSSP